MRIAKWLAVPMFIGVCTAWLAPALGQVDTAEAQKKLLSKRAAEADAYRKLAEAIKGMQITSETHVRDFVAESDQIRAALDDFIRGVRLGQAQWFEDGSCEVPAEVTVAKVIQTLKEIHERYYKGECGHCVKARDIEEMQQHVEKKVIKVVGQGAPREDLPPDLPEGVVNQLGGPPIPPRPMVPPIWQQIGPRGRLMAERAAELDGKRKLLERILGLRVTSQTQVRDFVAESDTIDTVANGTLIGATICRKYYHAEEPIVEVTVSVPVESVISTIKELHARSQHGHHVKGQDITEISRSIKTQTFEATGMGVPPPPVLQGYAERMPEKARFPDWAMAPIEMSGQGLPPPDKAGTPQGKLLAARAAEQDAKRKLAEYVHGLRISSNTTVKDFVAQRDEIRTQVDAVLVGATPVRTTFQDDTAEVKVSLPGMQVWEILSQGMRMQGGGRAAAGFERTEPVPGEPAPGQG